MKTKKNFLKKLSAVALGFVMTLGVGAAGYSASAKETQAGTNTVVFTVQGWAGSSNNGYITTATAGTGTITGSTNTIAATMIQHNPKNGQVKGNQTSVSNNWSMYNTEAIPGPIRSIVVNQTATGSNKFQNKLYVALGTSSQVSVSSITGLTASSVTTASHTFSNITGSNTYFKLLTSEKFASGTVTGTTITVTYDESASDPEKLDTPSPSYNDSSKTVSWSAVTGASSYQIKVDSGSYATDTSPFDVSDLTSGTQHTVYVKAIGDGTNYLDSDAGSCTFTPTAPKTVSSLAVTSSSHREFAYGATFVGETITATYSDASTGTVPATYSGYNMNQSGSQTVTASYGGKTVTYTITVAEKPAVPEYALVTNASNLESGDKLLIVGIKDGAYYSLAPYASGNNCRANAVATPVNNIIEGNCVELTLGGAADAWTLFDGTYYLYAAGGTGNNYLKGQTTAPSDTGKWTIECAADGVATIKCVATGTTRNTMRFNTNGDPLFSCYSSGQKDVYVYKKASAKVKSIALSGTYSTSFFTSDSFSHAGQVVTATLADNTTKDVSAKVTYSGYDMRTAGQQTVTVSYAASNSPSTTTGSAITTTYSITVTAVQLDHITISGPTKTTYNKGDTFDSTGLVVTAYYNNNTNKTVTPTSISGYDMSTPGTQTVTVTYAEGLISDSKTFTITVNDVVLSSIAISGSYPTSFYTGDTFSHAGLVVTATYSDESTVDVSTAAEFTGYNMASAGNQIVTVSYGGKTAQYGITVTQLALTSIALSGSYKTAYFVGDEFSSSGLVVTASYNKQGYSREVTPTSIEGYNMSSAGTQTVTVSYTENSVTKSATYSITVTAVVTTGLVLHTDNVQKTFEVGGTFNHDGLVVDVTKNNGTTVTNVSGYQVSSPNMEQLGEQTVTVTYDGKSATYTINISAEKLAYKIQFADAGSGKGDGTAELTTSDDLDKIFASGVSSVNSVTSISKVYPGKDGFGAKFSSSSVSGEISFSLKTQVKATKIVIEASQWENSKGAAETTTLNVAFNGGTQVEIPVSGLSISEYEIAAANIPNVAITSISFTSTSRAYVKSISVYNSKTEVQLIASNPEVEIYQGESFTPTITNGSTELTGWTLSTESSALVISGQTITGNNLVEDAQVKVTKAVDDNYVYTPCYISVTVIEMPAVTYTLKLVNGESETTYNKAERQVTNLESLVKEGYTFDGWSDGETLYNESFTMPAHNVTLTATFTPINYTVTYNSNGATGTAPTDSNIYHIGDDFIPASGDSLSINYKTFTGWNTKSDNSGVDYNAGEKYQFGSSDLILYAQFADIYCTITYNKGNAESGSTPRENDPVKAGTLYTVKGQASLVAPFGTEFAGWEYNGVVYKEGEQVLIEENVVFVAQFKTLDFPSSSQTGSLVFSDFHNIASGSEGAKESYAISDGLGTVVVNKADGSTAPTYYVSNTSSGSDKGPAMRIYYNNTITISSTKTFTSITFNALPGDDGNSISASVGTMSGLTWSGSATSITFTIGKNSKNESKGNRRIASIDVTTLGSGRDIPGDAIEVENLPGVGTNNPIVLSDGTTVEGLKHNYGMLFEGETVSFTASHGKVITYASVYMLYDYGYDLEYSNDYGVTWDYNPFPTVTKAKRAEGAGTEVGDLKDTNAVRFTLNDPESETEKDILKYFKVTTSFGTNSNMTVDYDWTKTGNTYDITITKAYARFAIDVDEDFNKYFTEKDQYGGNYWIGFAYNTSGGHVIVDDHLAVSDDVKTAQYTKGEMPANNEFGLKLNCLSNLTQDKTVALIVKDSHDNLVEFSKERTASFEDVFYAYFTDEVIAGLNAQERAVYEKLLTMFGN